MPNPELAVNTTRFGAKHVVGVSEMKISGDPADEIVTHSLGSCIGLAIYDPVAVVGGLLHFQLPLSENNAEKALSNPCMFADTGIPLLFRAAYAHGADKRRIEIRAAGGASVADKNAFFQIGVRNIVTMKKILWKNGVILLAEDLGGEIWRTMRMDVGTGRVQISTDSGKYEL